MNRKRASKDISVSVNMPRAMHAELMSFVKSRGLSLSAFMRMAACDAKDQTNRLQKAA